MSYGSYSHSTGNGNSPSQSFHQNMTDAAPHVGNPRSASELIVDHGNKFRQLPCRTFISVGTCPYRERCVYLHDPRCICREAKTKTRRKNKDDVVLDSMFWPIMSYNSVSTKLDNNRQPHVIQPYVVPPPQNDQYRRHDEAVHSMWMHFVDFCMATAESQHVQNADSAPCFAAPDLPVNAYTKQPRLPVFRALSSGRAAAEVLHKAPVKNSSLNRSTYQMPKAQEEVRHMPQQLTIDAKVDGKGRLNSPNCVSLRSPPRAQFIDPEFEGYVPADLCSESSDSSFHSLNDFDGLTDESSRRSSWNDVLKADGKAADVHRASPDGPALLWKQAQKPLNAGYNTMENFRTLAGLSTASFPSFLAFD